MGHFYKLLTILPILVLFSFESNAQCTYTAPYIESFNGTTTPTCWTESGSESWRYSTTAGYAAGSAGDHTGNGGNYAWIDGSSPSGANQISTLTSPLVNIGGLTTPALRYYVWSTNTTNPGDNNTLIIEFYDGAAWNTIDTVKQDLNNQWKEFIIDLSLFTVTGPVQARFTIIEDAGIAFYNDILLDDVEFYNGPTCYPPTGLAANNVLVNSANISWASAASNWEIEYGVAGFTPGTGTTVSATTNPASITGLAAATNYDFYVRAICAPSDTSSWSGPGTFTTPCQTFIAPFIESFNGTSTPNCWTESGSEAWRYSTTAGYAAGSAGDHTGNGGNYVWIDGSSPSGANQISTLTSPLVDLSGLTNPALRYYVWSTNTTNPGDNNTLIIEFNDGTTWNTLDTVKQDLGSLWQEYLFDLSLFTITGPVQARFTIIEDAGIAFYNDILLDDIEFFDGPSCFPPSSLGITLLDDDSLGVDWASSASQWQAEAVPAGGSPTGISPILTTSNTILSGLSPATQYDIYVRTICGPGDTSTWVMITQRTDCGLFLGDNSSTPIVIPSNSVTFSDARNTNDGCFTSVIANASADVWYELIVTDPCATEISATLCGSSYDTYLRFYDQNLTQLAFNDDDCGVQSSINNFAVSQGDTIYIVVEGFSSNNGNYVLNFTQTIDTTVADIAYSSTVICQNDVIATPINNGTAGGTFTELNGNTNLLLNGTTGAIDLVGTPLGNYSVVYDVALAGVPTCVDSDTFALTLATFDTAAISIGGMQYCQGLGQTVNPTITAATGGFFFSPSIQLDVDSTSGVVNIDNSPLGTFAIIYQTNANGCIDRDTQVININMQDTAGFSYPQLSFCLDGTTILPTNTSNNGGYYGVTPAGLMLDPVTGEIDPTMSTVGTYTVDFTTSGNCPDSQTETITVNADDDSGFGYAASTFCQNGTNPSPTITGLSGGTFSSPTGAIVDPTTGVIDLAASNLSTGHQISYTTSGPCPTTTTITVSIVSSSCTTTGVVSSDDLSNAYALYPNPNHGQFTIETDGEATDATIMIYNAIGQKVFEQNRFMTPTASAQLQLGDLSPGNYMVHITDAKQTTVIKMVVTQQ